MAPRFGGNPTLGLAQMERSRSAAAGRAMPLDRWSVSTTASAAVTAEAVVSQGASASGEWAVSADRRRPLFHPKPAAPARAHGRGWVCAEAPTRLYAIVRHPLYTAYMVGGVGYLMQSLSVWNAVVDAVAVS